MREAKPPGADDPLLVLALGLAPAPQRALLPSLILSDPPGLRTLTLALKQAIRAVEGRFAGRDRLGEASTRVSGR